jgi:glutaredoxin-dependent peroxiredoxin
MILKVGDKVPEFCLVTTDKKPFTNENIKGKTSLFLFFPAAFTSTCTRELCSVRDDIARYNNLQTQVIGISTDSVYALVKYKEEQSLNFLLASDFNKDVSAAFGASYELFNYNMKGASKRAAFVIDGDGIIQYAEVLDNSGLIPDFNEIKSCLEKLKEKQETNN